MSAADPLLYLLERLDQESVQYVLIGGQAVRLNGFVRATEDIDLLVEASAANGARIKRALDFLPAAAELDPDWFTPDGKGRTENIRVADALLVDLVFEANGETCKSLAPYVHELVIDGVKLRVPDIDGLLKTKSRYRAKDQLDRRVLLRIKRGLDAPAS
jgi:hypothetical protein